MALSAVQLLHLRDDESRANPFAPTFRVENPPRRRDNAKIGLVPTMGFFHEGHLSLMRRAREACDVVVVSLFVNPTQFNDPKDLEAYPRDEARDAAMAQSAGVDLLFAPTATEMYAHDSATTTPASSSEIPSRLKICCWTSGRWIRTLPEPSSQPLSTRS